MTTTFRLLGRSRNWLVASIAGLAVALPGCQSSDRSIPTGSANSGSANASRAEEPGHDHDHEEAGPHGGHLIVLGDEAYHAEWTHDDNSGLVTFYLLDGAAKNEARSAAESLVLEVRIGDQTRSHVLTPVDRNQDNPPTASCFAVTDKILLEALKAAGQGVDVRLTVEIAGNPYQASVEHAEHDAHGHDH